MGLCLSTPSPGAATPAGPAAAAMNPSSSSSWKGWTREKKRKRKGKGNNGRGDGNREGEEGGGNDRAMAAFSEEELHRLPGRMFLNAASEAACLYTQQGKKGTNQDAMLVWENFVSRSDTIFCGVFDGHGPFGHLVAKKVRDSLPLKLYTQWRRNISDHPHQNGSVPRSMSSEETVSISIGDEWTDPLDVDDDKKLPEMYLTLRQSLLRAFKSMDKELKLHSTIDCFCSGTTAVTIIKQGHDLVIGNVGDSRAILGARDNDGNLVAVQLTVDLKPNLPREAARIQQCRGRVFALQDEPEVARVWLPNNDSPGLAMARALGDFCLKDYGLISVPEISYRRLTEKDEFIVLATDGVWDALSNKEVVDIVASAPTRGTAARALVDCAVRAWRLKFPTSKIDDCAAICMYLKPRSSHQIQEDDLKESTKEPTELPLCSTAQVAINKEEVHESFISEIEIASSTHAHIHDDADEIVPIPDKPKEERVPGRSQSARSLADCISNSEEDEWSALEGITRVNSLLNLPRFLSSDKRSAVRRKWKKSQ